MSDPETKPGPASPGEEGPDSPTPPGGPQRMDAADPGLAAGDLGGGREAADSVEDQHGGTIPVEDEQAHPEPAHTEGEDQEENAETSLDQPSEG